MSGCAVRGSGRRIPHHQADVVDLAGGGEVLRAEAQRPAARPRRRRRRPAPAPTPAPRRTTPAAVAATAAGRRAGPPTRAPRPASSSGDHRGRRRPVVSHCACSGGTGRTGSSAVADVPAGSSGRPPRARPRASHTSQPAERTVVPGRLACADPTGAARRTRRRFARPRCQTTRDARADLEGPTGALACWLRTRAATSCCPAATKPPPCRRCCRGSRTGSALIVVDNGSRDGTAEVAARPGRHAWSASRRRATARPSTPGSRPRRRDYLAVMDGDGSFDPDDLLPLLAACRPAAPTWPSAAAGPSQRGSGPGTPAPATRSSWPGCGAGSAWPPTTSPRCASAAGRRCSTSESGPPVRLPARAAAARHRAGLARSTSRTSLPPASRRDAVQGVRVGARHAPHGARLRAGAAMTARACSWSPRLRSPGRAKTRLGADVGPGAAAELAAAALLDTLDACARRSGLAAVTSRCPATSPTAYARASWRPRSRLDGPRRSSAATSADRLAHAHADVGPGPVVQIGMDTPQLTAALLARGRRPGCDDHDAVLGPAADGGWWALALRDPARAAVLRGVPMSTPTTYADTRAALEAAGLRVDQRPRPHRRRHGRRRRRGGRHGTGVPVRPGVAAAAAGRGTGPMTAAARRGRPARPRCSPRGFQGHPCPGAGLADHPVELDPSTPGPGADDRRRCSSLSYLPLTVLDVRLRTGPHAARQPGRPRTPLSLGIDVIGTILSPLHRHPWPRAQQRDVFVAVSRPRAGGTPRCSPTATSGSAATRLRCCDASSRCSPPIGRVVAHLAGPGTPMRRLELQLVLRRRSAARSSRRAVVGADDIDRLRRRGPGCCRPAPAAVRRSRRAAVLGRPADPPESSRIRVQSSLDPVQSCPGSRR